MVSVNWSDKYIQALLKYRTMTLREFIKAGGDIDSHRLIKDSKVGYIKITKISDNDGYLREGEFEQGITAAFGEGLSLYISDKDRWYRTSNIRKIYWDKGEFTTINSRYKFEFTEIDYRPILNELNNESTSN